MKYTKNTLLLLSLCFLSSFMFSQRLEQNHRRVLYTDSGSVFEKKFIATEFGDSYFMFLNEYNVGFSETEFDSFKAYCDNIGSGIKAIKSADNKKLMCVFPKSSLHGITSFANFVDSNFNSNCKSSCVLKKTTHIEVVRLFDPLDKQSERGFN